MNKKSIGLFVLICVLIGASRKYNLFSMNESDQQKVKEYHERLKAAQEDPKAQEELRKFLVTKAPDWVRRSTKQPGKCPLSKDFINFLLGGGPITLRGHTWRVNSVAFTPDGSKVATGSGDHTATLWDAHTGDLLRTFAGHTDQVSSVVFSPDGSKLATASADRTAKLWDVNTGQLLHSLQVLDTPHGPSIVWSVAFSPDGSKLATGSFDNTAKLWDVNTGQLLHALDGHTETIRSVAFSPDGSKLATGSFDRTAKIWNVNTGQLLHTLAGHTNAIYSVVFSPDGSKFATGSKDHMAKLWDVNTGQLLHTLAGPNGHTNEVYSVAFSPDGNKLATGSFDKTAKLWDVNTGDLLHTLAGHPKIIWSIAFSPDGNKLATGSHDKTVKLWDVHTGQLLHTLAGHTNDVSSVVFSPDGSKIATGSHDHTAKLWDVNRLDKIAKLRKEEIKQKGKNLKPYSEKISLQRFLKILPKAINEPPKPIIIKDECKEDPEYCNIMSVEQCELLRAFQELFHKERFGKQPIEIIKATPAQWQTFKTFPDVLQEILRNRIKEEMEIQKNN